jgi:hypothetical protein
MFVADILGVTSQFKHGSDRLLHSKNTSGENKFNFMPAVTYNNRARQACFK